MNSEVRIVAPAGVAHTNGVLEVRLEVAGNVPDRLELLRDGEVLAVLEPPYVYAWDTTVEAEGEHTLRTRTVFGETVFEGESREVVVDRTPPRLVTRTPEPGAQMVWVKAPIQAEFSEPMRVDTVTSTTVRLTVGDSEVSRTVGLSGDGKTLTVSPGEGYAPSNPVRLVLTESVVDLAGNSLVPESRGWDWVVPFWIPWGTGNGARTYLSSDETMGSYTFDTAGNLIAVWLDKASSYRHLRVRRFANGEWTDYGSSVAASPHGFYGDSILLTAEGNPIVAWTQLHDASSFIMRVHVARWTGSTWEQLGTSVESDAAMKQKMHPHLEWSPSGQPAIAWSESTGQEETTVCAAVWNSTEWSRIGDCFSALSITNDSTNPVLRYKSDATPIIAWIANGQELHSAFVNEFTNNTWNPLAASDHFISQQGPRVSLTIGTGDTPFIAWTDSIGKHGPFGALSTSIWAESGWESLGPPALSIGYEALKPTIQADKTGFLFAAWSNSTDTNGVDLHAARWTGLQWESLDDLTLNIGSHNYSSPHSLHMTQGGEIILSWEQVESGSRMRVRRFNR
ncbi:Ig-like domain-containing protein [Myxococcus faecalis]|uniref:Ig-like domain-containing protein n=1 Tax=Myxococcus faecalis TaxID=3115646 RepID=UPI0024C81B46|nr:Ig-like domain-containing protein [Myxococcus sp. MH1]